MKIQQLQFDPKNANRGTERGRKALTESLKQYGAGRSILVDKKGRVIAGNKTLEQAIAAGHKDVLVVKTDGTKLVAVQRMDLDLKDKRAKALAIADNRVSELDLEWDEAVLAELGKEIDLSAFWSSGELEKLLGIPAGEAPEPQLDKAAELQKKWNTKLGQLWLIGPHRVLCGDSTKKASLARVCGTKRPKVVFTDPPYGIDYETMRSGTSKIANDASADEAVKATTAALQLVADAEAYFVCCDWRSISSMAAAMQNAEIEPKACIVWDKKHGVQNLDRYFKQHELILYSGPYGGQETVCGDVWECARDFSVAHATPKPPALIAKALTSSSEEGAIAYDPFAGSGSSICAAEQTSRVCYAIEIEPKYVAVALERLSGMGLKPKLD